MSDRDVPATSWAVWAWQAYRDGRLVEADRIEELEAKLAQQDDLVQAAVAAALREAAALMFDDLWITADNDREEGYDEGLSAAANAILALITLDAHAALNRVKREAWAKGSDAGWLVGIA
jgi:hypothetical protein